MARGADGARRRKPIQQPSRILKKAENLAEKPRSFLWRVAFFLVAVAVSFLVHAYVRSPIKAVVFKDFPDMDKLDWPFSPNAELQNGERIHSNLIGPESIAYDEKGTLYTGLPDGRVVEIINEKRYKTILDVPKWLQSAGQDRRKETHPLGMRYRNGTLYFADEYQGLFSCDVVQRRCEKLVNYDDVKPPMMFVNDLTITGNGRTIYFTDSSTRWHSAQAGFIVFGGDCTGRIFKYDLETKSLSMYKDRLCFPNGIQLSADEETLLVSELNKFRIKFLDTQSGRTKKVIVLPGGPDNIRPANGGGFWVGVATLYDRTMEILVSYPILRRLVAGVFMESLFNFLNMGQGTVVRLSEDGDVVRALYDVEGKLAYCVTEVTELETGQLLLGSFMTPGMVRINAPLNGWL